MNMSFHFLALWLQVQGALEEPMKACLRSSPRLRGLLFGAMRASIWQGALSVYLLPE